MKLVIVVMAVAGCWNSSSLPPESVRVPAREVPPVLRKVGSRPRVYATIAFARPWIHDQLAEVTPMLPTLLGRSPSACGIELTKLDRVRVAIGEPLRIAAEIDGGVDVKAISCLLGGDGISALAKLGLVFRDRPGGIALDYNVERAEVPAAADIAARCTAANCVSLRVGSPTRSIWVVGDLDDATRFRLDGPGLGGAAAAFVSGIDKLRATIPALAPLKAIADHGALVVELPSAPQPAVATAIKDHLLEAFKIPSTSMVPTLLLDDQVFAVKGPLLGTPTVGDVLVYRTDDGPDYVTRYVAGGDHTVSESEAGLAIDGTLLPNEPLGEFRYRDQVYGRDDERRGTLVREHLGSRSYLTLRTGPPRAPGPWAVAEGTLFLVGDNRNNSNDSRYNGATPVDHIRGRVVVIWLAFRDGTLDWDRIGTPVE